MITTKEYNEHAERLEKLVRMANLKHITIEEYTLTPQTETLNSSNGTKKIIITGIELEAIARGVNCDVVLNEKVIINDMYIGVCTGVLEDTVIFRIEEIMA